MDWACPSCGTVSGGAYCPGCGERRLPTASVRASAAQAHRERLARSAAGRVVARLRASLAALASPPGRLTRDWIDGRRVGYVSPLSLFLYVNVAFFLIQSASHVSILAYPLAVHLDDNFLGLPARLFASLAPGNALADNAYVAVFNALETVNAKALVITMVPAFALPLAALPLCAGRGTRYGNALACSAHFFAYAL
ncbi:MAG: DUF3667 domain-containing protein, partial [Proteobacteria bacterium]|nr:DUF3667 domain-containing protein [Pseudomonadota bacterium]